jgi:hypothetical protein
MQNGGKIPVTKLWAKYGSKENLKKKLQEGGYLEEGQEMDDDMISRMEQDLANQGSMNMDMNMPTQEVEQEEENEVEEQESEEEGNVLAEYSNEQLQSMLQELQGREDEDSMQIMQMIAQELQSRQQQTAQQQPTQEAQPMLKYGGAIVGMPDLARYVGKSHAQGGILVDAKGNPTTNETNAVAEVEGGEVKYDIDGEPYIFSKRLKI